MSLAPGINNPAIDKLVQSSLESENEDLRLEWVPYKKITNIEPTQSDNVHYGIYKHKTRYGVVINETVMLLFLGNSEECTQTLVDEFARKHSLPTHKYNSDDNNFKRYSKWLTHRNCMINGFTRYEENYYMVVKRRFYHCYSRYGFCSKCRHV